MAKKLTDAFVRSATKAGITWDAATTGLGLKVLPGSGGEVTRKWVMQLVWPGSDSEKQSRRNITGGVYPAMSLEAARAKAHEIYAAAKAGRDLFKEEAEAKKATERERAAKVENTFAAIAERYIAERTNRRASVDAREVRRMLVAEWGNRPISDITPRDVRQLFERLTKHSAYDARNAWGHASGIFKWAVHEELIEVSPLASLDRRLLFRGAKIEPRQRVLNDDEVFAFWRASRRLGLVGSAYRLLLLTGCRVSEIVGARWSELHPDLRKALRDAAKKGERVDWSAVPDEHKTLTIPRERFKSNAEHVVQLTDAACEVMEGVPHMAGSDFIFTSNGEAPLWLGAKHKVRLDARMLRTLRALARRRGDDASRVRLEPWVQHDLRRVVRTNLSALGVEDHVAEMVLGHGRKGLQRVYDQHRYQPEIRKALGRWAGRLREIVEPAPTAPPVEPSKVVAFKRGARR